MVERENKQGIADFFSSRYRKLVGYLRGRYADLSDMEVEDIVSDLMTELFDKADITDHVENMAAYIYRSMRNKVVDYLRRRKKTVSFDDAAEGKTDSAGRETIPEPSYDMQADIEAAEIRRRLFDALAALQPNQRAVWIATELDGRSFRELAEQWNVPMGTLLARKHRANAALQKELQDLKNG